MTWLKRIAVACALLAVALLGALLAVDNHGLVALRFLGWESAQLAVFWWLYVAFLGGALVGFALCAFGFVRGKLGERRLKRALAERDRELERLRSAQQPAPAPTP